MTHPPRLLELKWDYIFFTGSTHVGRVVAAAAAVHTSPFTLEMSSKSPVVTNAENTDLGIVTRRVF